jgi:hypothetical protein
MKTITLTASTVIAVLIGLGFTSCGLDPEERELQRKRKDHEEQTALKQWCDQNANECDLKKLTDDETQCLSSGPAIFSATLYHNYYQMSRSAHCNSFLVRVDDHWTDPAFQKLAHDAKQVCTDKDNHVELAQDCAYLASSLKEQGQDADAAAITEGACYKGYTSSCHDLQQAAKERGDDDAYKKAIERACKAGSDVDCRELMTPEERSRDLEERIQETKEFLEWQKGNTQCVTRERMACRASYRNCYTRECQSAENDCFNDVDYKCTFK